MAERSVCVRRVNDATGSVAGTQGPQWQRRETQPARVRDDLYDALGAIFHANAYGTSVPCNGAFTGGSSVPGMASVLDPTFCESV